MSVVFRIKGLHFYLSNPSINSVGQYPSSKRKEESVDIWNEIDRRNEHVLNPLNSKSSSKSPKHFSKYYHQFTNNTAKSFYLNSYRSCRQRRPSSHHSDDRIYLDPTIYLNKYLNKQSSVTSINTDPSFLFGNSIIKSNKADILNIFDQQLLNGDDANTFVNKHGITIDEDGPFWPENYRILHPTPKLLSREMTPKEFYLSPSMPGKKKREKN
jgi:hypothetical protein